MRYGPVNVKQCTEIIGIICRVLYIEEVEFAQYWPARLNIFDFVGNESNMEKAFLKVFACKQFWDDVCSGQTWRSAVCMFNHRSNSMLSRNVSTKSIKRDRVIHVLISAFTSVVIYIQVCSCHRIVNFLRSRQWGLSGVDDLFIGYSEATTAMTRYQLRVKQIFLCVSPLVPCLVP